MSLQPEKILRNELRAQILEILRENAASPAQLAERVGERRSQVAYHVAVLTETGFIRPVETREERGCVVHVYALTPAARDDLEQP